MSATTIIDANNLSLTYLNIWCNHLLSRSNNCYCIYIDYIIIDLGTNNTMLEVFEGHTKCIVNIYTSSIWSIFCSACLSSTPVLLISM